jgi:hypothetical protein
MVSHSLVLHLLNQATDAIYLQQYLYSRLRH